MSEPPVQNNQLPKKGIFAEYCRSSSIHGLKYLVERRQSTAEKIFWIFMFLLSFLYCGRSIFDIYVKWDKSPVIISFSEKAIPMWQIPFPAVTICPETKTRKSAFNFTGIYHRVIRNETLTEDEMSKLEIVAQICDEHLFTKFKLGGDIISPDCIEQLLNMSLVLDQTIYSCKYQKKNHNCEKLFAPIITEDGVCFTFNALNGRKIYRNDTTADDYFYYKPFETNNDDWTLENGYSSSNFDVYPKRILPNEARGLYVILSLNDSETDHLCRGHMQGFKVLIHSPDELPRVSKHYLYVPLAQGVTVRVKPQMMQTAGGLKNYSPERRQCYFNHERQLKYFQIYTQYHCELECLTNLTLRECGCVKFSMPRDNYTPICGAAQSECLLEAKDNVLMKKIDYDLSNDKKSHLYEKCNCLPACTSIKYETQTSLVTYNWQDLFNAYENPEYPNFHFARLQILFEEEEFTTSKRSEIYGLTDFLANSGGLMGLFMGVSLFSFFEIFYFCIVRLCCNFKGKSKDNGKLTNH